MDFTGLNLGSSVGYFNAHAIVPRILLAILLALVVHYCALLAFNKLSRSRATRRTPPLIPYCIPLVGSIPWQYFSNPIEFFTASKYFARLEHPVRIRLLFKTFYLNLGTEYVLAHLAQTSTSNTIFNANFLRHACAMSEKAIARLGSDSEETPKYFERKGYLTAAPLYAWSSSVIHHHLTGRGAVKLSQRFENNLQSRINAHSALVSPGGLMMDNFADFFVDDVTAALLTAMCGNGLLDRNPTLTKAFRTFCDSLPTFMKRTPRIFAPQAYRARDEVLAAMRDWQTWASQNFDAATTPLDEGGDDPYWGSKFFRERFLTFVYEMGFDPEDMASMELGFLFGASANATANTYWCVIEVFKDKALLEAVRKEVQASMLERNGDVHFDVNLLIQQPLLQAIFAESLRLRCHNMFIRKTTETIDIGDWAVPGDHFVIAWSTPSHMNSRVWCDVNDAHPVDQFWPGRFLKCTDDSRTRRFSLAGMEGSWLPFGSGANICPGRNFAKIHSILTVAMMVESFDCDILAKPEDLKLDLSKFGMGVAGPRGKVAVRLCKRAPIP